MFSNRQQSAVGARNRIYIAELTIQFPDHSDGAHASSRQVTTTITDTGREGLVAGLQKVVDRLAKEVQCEPVISK